MVSPCLVYLTYSNLINNLKLKLMKTLKELLDLKTTIKNEIQKVTQDLNKQLHTVERQIDNYEDGYTYHVAICSYGSVYWEKFNNPIGIYPLIKEYQDGYDGLVEIYTDNPTLVSDLESEDQGCGRYYTLDELPEHKRNVSKSDAFVNNMTRGLGYE